MLFILFSAGDDSYAIAANEVEEVVPYARLKSLPQTHPALVGLLNFHGQPIPVLDVNQMLGQKPVEELFTTRILLCRGVLRSEPEKLLGLVAENVIETLHTDEKAFRSSGVSSGEAPYAGPIFEMADGRYLQRVHVSRILPEELARKLFEDIQEAV